MWSPVHPGKNVGDEQEVKQCGPCHPAATSFQVWGLQRREDGVASTLGKQCELGGQAGMCRALCGEQQDLKGNAEGPKPGFGSTGTLYKALPSS